MGPPWFGPPTGWGFPGGPGGGRRRQRKGDVRLAVLTLLAEQPMHGYQIINELTERSNGAWRPSPGSVYPTLQQLEDEGMVTVSEVDGRRTYTLTDAGRAELDRAGQDRRPPWEQPDDDDASSGLRRRAGEVMAAVMQVATAGTPGQVERAERVLADTRRALYRLLAEDDEDDAGEESRP
jgi:DNA-binding PadR family transcriptional regulator